MRKSETVEDMIAQAEENVRRAKEREELLHAMASVLISGEREHWCVSDLAPCSYCALLARYESLYPKEAGR